MLEDSTSRGPSSSGADGFFGAVFVAIAVTEKGELADDPDVDSSGSPRTTLRARPFEDRVYDAVMSTIEGLPARTPRSRRPGESGATRRRGRTINVDWGKKPPCWYRC